MNRLVNPAKALRTLRKTPALLNRLLAGVSQEQALRLRDGAAGWNILTIVCHLRDIEAIFMRRASDLLRTPHPTFMVVSNEALIERGNYAAQELGTVLAEYHARRAEFTALLETVRDDQWMLEGVHPQQGPATLLDVAVNAGLHDVDHLEQIARCLDGST